MKVYIINGIEYKDFRIDYWNSYGDYNDIYNQKLNFFSTDICHDIISTIKHLPRNSVITISSYLKNFQVNDPKEIFRLTYEILNSLEGILILPEQFYNNYLAFPYNMPYLKIK